MNIQSITISEAVKPKLENKPTGKESNGFQGKISDSPGTQTVNAGKKEGLALEGSGGKNIEEQKPNDKIAPINLIIGKNGSLNSSDGKFAIEVSNAVNGMEGNTGNVLNITKKELLEILKGISNSNSLISDIHKILKTEKIMQKNGVELSSVNQLKENGLINSIKLLINELENVKLKHAFEELMDIMLNPATDISITLNELKEKTEEIYMYLNDMGSKNSEEEISSVKNRIVEVLMKVENGVNKVEGSKVDSGNFNLFDKKEAVLQTKLEGEALLENTEMEKEFSMEGSLTLEKPEDSEFALLNESKNAERTSDKSMKYQEMTLHQFKKDIGDKLNQIQKMVALQDKMLVHLNPKNLGNMEIFIQKTKDGLEISIEIEKKIAKGQVEIIMEEVKKDFKDKNIDILFSFSEREHEKEESKERKNEKPTEDRKVRQDEETVDFKNMIEEILGEE